MGLIYTAVVLFSLAAILGLYLISLVLQNKQTPKGIALIHGFFAATALILVIIHAVVNQVDMIQIIVLFALAALGGFVLFARDIMGKSLPKSLAVVHGLLAVSGIIFLLMYAFWK
jgi:hypothetical protein